MSWIYKVPTASGGGNSFTIMQPDHGTAPTASSSADTLTFTSSDASVNITGNSATKVLNFQAAAAGANTTLSNLGTTAINASLIFGTDATFNIGSSNTAGRVSTLWFASLLRGDSTAGIIQVGTNVAPGPTPGIYMYAAGGANAVYLYNDTLSFVVATTAGLLSMKSAPGAHSFYDASNVAKFTMDANSNVAVGSAALLTTATNGFFYIPTCAGAPSGVPTTKTGLAPMVIDTTNNKFWVYVNGAWKGVVVA